MVFEIFFAKYSAESRIKLSKKIEAIWESDDCVDECRDCGAEFSLFWRQHHCRSCGGIYCDACCPGTDDRMCIFCMRGMMPGAAIFHYQTDTHSSVSNRYYKDSNTAAFDCVTFIPLPRLMYGSLYDDNFVRLDERDKAHKSGYFQFTNRADTMCAVKIVAEGANLYNEIFRPPYLSVLPKGSVHTLIEGLTSLYIIVLYCSTVKLPEGQEVVFTSMKEKNVSAPCKVKNYTKYSMYKIRSLHKNVLLKYQEPGLILPRSGKSRRLKYKAAEFFTGAFSSSKVSTSPEPNPETVLDFKSNIEEIIEILV